MQILHRDKLPRGGFEGVRETRLLFDERVGGAPAGGDVWQGPGGFVYLADARFVPGGQTKMHRHHEIDVITLVLEGQVTHEGSLEHGRSLAAFDAQVQRAGGEGFSHNEINPDATENRLLQLWVLPEHAGEAAGYRFYQPGAGGVTRIYGGEPDQANTFASSTCIDIVRLSEGQSLDVDKPALVYVALGRCFANEETAVEGDLMHDDAFTFDAAQDTLLVLVHETGAGAGD